MASGAAGASHPRLAANSKRRPTGLRQTTVRDFVIDSPAVAAPAPTAAAATVTATVTKTAAARDFVIESPVVTAVAGAAVVSFSPAVATPASGTPAGAATVPSSSPETTPRRATRQTPITTAAAAAAASSSRGPLPLAPTLATPTDATSSAEPPAKRKRAAEDDAGRIQLAVQKFGPESRAVNELDAIAAEISRTLTDYRQRLVDRNERVPELDAFEREVDIELTAQNELVDEHRLMQLALRKTTNRQKQARADLLLARRQRAENLARLQQLRNQHAEEVRTRKKTEDAHDFLSQLAILHDKLEPMAADVALSDNAPLPATAANLASAVAGAKVNCRNVELVQAVNVLLQTVSTVLDRVDK